MASSSDGTRMIATATGNGGLFSSSDAGATWTKRVGDNYWGAIALSSTGLKAAVAFRNGISYSTDGGTTWSGFQT